MRYELETQELNELLEKGRRERAEAVSEMILAARHQLRNVFQFIGRTFCEFGALRLIRQGGPAAAGCR